MSQPSTGSASATLGANLDGVLKRFLGLIPDARQITVSTQNGAELLSESRMGENVEDSHTISSLAPSFNISPSGKAGGWGEPPRELGNEVRRGF